MKKLLIVLATMAVMISPASARFNDPIEIGKVRADAVFVCKNLANAVREIRDEIRAVKNKLTPKQYWTLLKPMLEKGECAPTAMQYKPLKVICKWIGVSYKDDDTPLDIKTMRLFRIQVIVPAGATAKYKFLYLITDKEGPDPVKDACESIK